jgi:hypothetical protein
VWTRSQAIARLRAALQPMCGPDRSMCEVAAQKGIFCRGFRRWHDAEFHRRWKPALGASTHLNRAQMEQLADLWQLSEQLRCSVAFACDANALRPGACRGWNEFTNETLSRFCADLLGVCVVVTEDFSGELLTPTLVQEIQNHQTALQNRVVGLRPKRSGHTKPEVRS